MAGLNRRLQQASPQYGHKGILQAEVITMKLGSIGTGNRGNPVAANVAWVGRKMTVHDLYQGAATNPLEMGVQRVGRPRQVVLGNEVVFTSPHVPLAGEAVGRGEERTLASAVNGLICAELSTS